MVDVLEALGYRNSVALYDKSPTNPKLIEHIQKLYWDVQQRGEPDWLYSCRDKIRYGTAWEATKASYRMSQWRGWEFDPYKCRFCDKYHVGRLKEDRAERKRFYEQQIRRALPQG